MVAKLFFLFAFIFSPNVFDVVRILHLTDIHYDPYFTAYSSIYSSCHRISRNENEEVSNYLWGRECDSSSLFVKRTFHQISADNNNISLIFLTGDNSR